jgi:hypothetical protein
MKKQIREQIAVIKNPATNIFLKPIFAATFENGNSKITSGTATAKRKYPIHAV